MAQDLLSTEEFSKQVNLIETEMIGVSLSYPMVGVVTQSEGLENTLAAHHSNT